MTILKLHHFDHYLPQYLDERHRVFNHQLSGVEANRRDLNLFSRFCHQTGCHDINGDVILTFIAWLKYERENSAGAINRKISSVRSYIKYLRFRQVDGADDLPVEYLSRARQPYTGPLPNPFSRGGKTALIQHRLLQHPGLSGLPAL